MKTLEGKTVIVVGASGGIGSVASRVFYEQGASVVLAARNKERLEEVRFALGNERTLVVSTDASIPGDVRWLFDQVSKVFSKIDAIFITAGRWDRLTPDENAEKALERMNFHHHSLFLPTFVAAWIAQEYFRAQGGGLIANVSSHAAVRPYLLGNLSYGPAKAASRHFMLALREELADTGVRVVDLQPAIVNTPDNGTLLDTEEKRRKAVQPEDIAEWVVEHFDDPDIPAERLFDSEVTLD